MIITFLGHSSLITCENLLAKIKKTILENTKADENISFFCGGYGEFDNLSMLACRLVKEERPNSEVIFVTPYLKSIIDFANYDEIIYPPLENVPHSLTETEPNWFEMENSLPYCVKKAC
ncbi:MAG: hypothetical protein IJW54_04640 [Clostridia bacterium]|nr:hypothetical protein [Clostridia bacterium]